jgi:Na+/H+ antiporter NhaC
MSKLKSMAWSLMVVAVVSIGSFIFFSFVQKKPFMDAQIAASEAVPLSINKLFIIILVLVALVVTRFVLKKGVEIK